MPIQGEVPPGMDAGEGQLESRPLHKYAMPLCNGREMSGACRCRQAADALWVIGLHAGQGHGLAEVCHAIVHGRMLGVPYAYF